MVGARDLVVMAAGLPVALFALALPHNEYSNRRLIIAIPCLALCALFVPKVAGALAEQRHDDLLSETGR